MPPRRLRVFIELIGFAPADFLNIFFEDDLDSDFRFILSPFF